MSIERMVPPGSSAGPQADSYLTTPADIGGSFLLSETPGYDELVKTQVCIPDEALTMVPSESYSQYLKMHKVMVGQCGAAQLEQIQANLETKYQPRYLSAAGSAAVEVGLVQTAKSTAARLALVDRGVACWRRSIEIQRACNADGPDHLIEHSAPYRSALNVAIAPLIRGVITGGIAPETARSVYGDCLAIAQASLIQGHLLFTSGDTAGGCDQLGFNYEANALLAYNRRYSGRLFMMPAFERSDSGHHHSRQTHDLMVVERQGSRVKTITPIEIKSSAGLRQRQRYGALLVRGKLHLSVPNEVAPRYTLEAIAACYEGNASHKQRRTTHIVSQLLNNMINDYQAGAVLADVVPSRHGTGFRDKALVIQKYPGLSVVAA